MSDRSNRPTEKNSPSRRSNAGKFALQSTIVSRLAMRHTPSLRSNLLMKRPSDRRPRCPSGAQEQSHVLGMRDVAVDLNEMVTDHVMRAVAGKLVNSLIQSTNSRGFP